MLRQTDLHIHICIRQETSRRHLITHSNQKHSGMLSEAQYTLKNCVNRISIVHAYWGGQVRTDEGPKEENWESNKCYLYLRMGKHFRRFWFWVSLSPMVVRGEHSSQNTTGRWAMGAKLPLAQQLPQSGSEKRSTVLELSFTDFIEFMFNQRNLLFKKRHNRNTIILVSNEGFYLIIVLVPIFMEWICWYFIIILDLFGLLCMLKLQKNVSLLKLYNVSLFW